MVVAPVEVFWQTIISDFLALSVEKAPFAAALMAVSTPFRGGCGSFAYPAIWQSFQEILYFIVVESRS